MKIRIELLGSEKKIWEAEVEEGTTYEKLLEDIGINPETVVVVRDKIPVPMDEEVKPGEIKLIRVISGG